VLIDFDIFSILMGKVLLFERKERTFFSPSLNKAYGQNGRKGPI
jgi:hypothetical protein